MTTAAQPARKRTVAPRLPVPALSLAAAHRGCGIEDAVTVAGRESYEHFAIGDEVAVLVPMRVHQIVNGELVLHGPSGNRRVARKDVYRHVELTR